MEKMQMKKDELEKLLKQLAKKAEKGTMERDDFPDKTPYLFARIAAYSWTYTDVNEFIFEMLNYDAIDGKVREIAENVLTHSKWDAEEE
jgi:hypothetical protein